MGNLLVLVHNTTLSSPASRSGLRRGRTPRFDGRNRAPRYCVGPAAPATGTPRNRSAARFGSARLGVRGPTGLPPRHASNPAAAFTRGTVAPPHPALRRPCGTIHPATPTTRDTVAPPPIPPRHRYP